MQQIQRSIQLNQKILQADQYDKNLKAISRITFWHESKAKFDGANQQKFKNKTYKEGIKTAYNELKIRRNKMLKDLYENEAKQWEGELALKGKAIYKNKL